MGKPFYVCGRGLEEEEEAEVPQLVRKGEENKWTEMQQSNLQNDMLREMARLSLAPMGLEAKQLEEMQEELAANMKYERLEEKRMATVIEKAVDLIQAGEMQNVPRQKTKAF